MDFAPIWISLKTVLVAMFFTFFLGMATAWGVINIKNKTIKTLIDSLISLMQVLPPTVIGFLLLAVVGNNRPIGQFFVNVLDLQFAFTWYGTVLVAFVISYPLMYRACKIAFEEVGDDLIGAAKTLGMKNHEIFFKIVLGNSVGGVISGFIMAFTRAIGEYGATAMLAGNIKGKTRTLPIAIYAEVTAGNMNMAFKYVLVLVGIALFAILSFNFIELYKGDRGY